MEGLIEFDKELFLLFNGLHTPWLDGVMWYVSKTITWIPLYSLLAFFIVKDFKKRAWIVFVAVALSITMSDQITTSLMKPYFERLRPSHEPSLAGSVHLINQYAGGRYGFASSHAANTFAVSMLMALLFAQRRGWMYFLFLWAAVVSFSRVYLGVHYPGDILAGAGVGMLIACLIFIVLKRYTTKLDGEL